MDNQNAVQFSSDMSAKAAQPQDYFAEQNRERTEKQQKAAKLRKRILIAAATLLGGGHYMRYSYSSQPE